MASSQICTSLPCASSQRKPCLSPQGQLAKCKAQFNQIVLSSRKSLTLSSSTFGNKLKCSKSRQTAQERGGRLIRTGVQASLAPVGSEVAVASALFTLATAAVIPLYTLMLLAPDRPLTKRVINSSIPWILLGLLYLYLLALSWTPLTLPSMFSSKYWLPELPAITRMFSSTLTVASAWIHLLALDLYAARSVYLEGIRLGFETRHSLCLCLLFAPLGILCHSLTKAFVLRSRDKVPPQDSNTDLDLSLP